MYITTYTWNCTPYGNAWSFLGHDDQNMVDCPTGDSIGYQSIKLSRGEYLSGADEQMEFLNHNWLLINGLLFWFYIPRVSQKSEGFIYLI